MGLTAAGILGRKDLVLLLLDRGADMNVAGRVYGTALAAAAFVGNMDFALLLLNRGADINVVGDKYGTALAAAAFAGNMDIVLLLLDRGTDLSLVGGEYGTALTAAASEGNIDIVSLLLDRGADINLVGGKYGTALTAAASEGNIDIVSLLLDRGADINLVGGKYWTPLTVAAHRLDEAMLLLLLDRGANINAVGGKYGTALTTAVLQGNTGIVSLLLDRGADINIDDGFENALTIAVNELDNEMVMLLLDRGADINAVCGEYGTALGLAVYRAEYTNNTDMISLLLERNADINVVGGVYGTALGVAINHMRKSMDIVLLLIDQGADINVVGGDHGTALGMAAYNKNIAIVSLLLDLGADINVAGVRWGTPLAVAAKMGDMDIVSLLLDRGADINVVGGKLGTALAAAAVNRNTDTVSLLLDRGADIHVVGGEYGTALAAAAGSGARDIVLQLLDRGANINEVTSDSGYGTALIAAVFSGYRYGTDALSLLLDRGADINAVGGEYGTALAAAAFIEVPEVLSLLLDRGANINVVGGKYGTALAAAAHTSKNTMVSLLLDQGADVNVVSGEYGTALIAAACSRIGSEESALDIVFALLGRGADINAVDEKYGNALTAAAFEGREQIVSLLLDRGADINAMYGDYVTALGAATAAERKEMVSLLVDKGADLNIVTSEFGTVLGQAIYKGSTEIALLLLRSGANVMRIGGSYLTTSGVYPNALDVAHAVGSRASAALCRQLEIAIGKQQELEFQATNLNVDLLLSRPPFPMPYTKLLGANHHKGTLPSSLINSFDTLSTIITQEQADVPCRELDEEVLWRSLGALVGLHEDTIHEKHQWIRNDVCYFVACNFDFGLAYAAARVAWEYFNKQSSKDISILRGLWLSYGRALDEDRLKAIEIDHSSSGQEVIISPYSIMPRRLWDLKSNRIVDFRMLHAVQQATPIFWAVSHSWTNDMSAVLTSINQHQWPVPLPQSITLGYLRSELLTLGAEYIWLDVICLRQRSGVAYLERFKQTEWKLDVPTIGNIYKKAQNIVRYFNGLGIRFSSEGWDGPRHWLQRAWTMQEIADESNTINGGIPDDGQVFLNTQGEVIEKVNDILVKKKVKLRSAMRPIIQLAAQVDSKRGCGVYELMLEMTRRYSSKPVDKLSGLFYLLHATKLPCYNESMTSEDFWRQCFHLLPAERKSEILFDFPYRGSDEQWYPTWAQMLDWPTRDPEYDHTRPEDDDTPSPEDDDEPSPEYDHTQPTQRSPYLTRDIPGNCSFFMSKIWTISDAVLSDAKRPGEYRVKVWNRSFSFYMPYLSQKPINMHDHSVFTLAVADLGHTYNWVVCKQTERDTNHGVIVVKKVGVLRTDSCSVLLAARENGEPLLQKRDCIFV